MANKFIDGVSKICSAWLNAVDWVVYDVFKESKSAAEARTAIDVPEEAPSDNSSYLRRNKAWQRYTTPTIINDHNNLINKDLSDQHPMGAITGLDYSLAQKADVGALDGKADVSHTHVANDVTDLGGMALVDDAPNDAYQYARQGNQWAVVVGGSGGGTNDHNVLINRNIADQHPISAVTGLQTALDGKITQANADLRYLQLTGGTLSGFLTLSAAPTADLHASTKKYVDDGLGGKASTSHTHTASQVTDLGTMATKNDAPSDDSIYSRQNGAWVVASGGGTTDHSVLTNRSLADQHPISAITGLQTALDGKLTSATADPLYVNVGGDTMTGALELPAANPTTDNQATRKAYVDTQVATKISQTQGDARYLQLTGGTLSGQLTLPTSNPTADNHATRKAYVDNVAPWQGADKFVSTSEPGASDGADGDIWFVI